MMGGEKNANASSASQRSCDERGARAVQRRMNIVKRATLLAAVMLSTASCGGDESCVVPPCAFPIGMIIRVRSATGLVIPTAVVRQLDASGSVISTTACGGEECLVGQHIGTYRLSIGAPPAFASRDTTVNVTGTEGTRCTCTSLDTRQFTFTLVAAPPV